MVFPHFPIYLSGQLRSPHHLPIATQLADLTSTLSNEQFALVLPQNFSPRPETQIQENLLRLLDCKGALFVGESTSLIQSSLSEILLALLAHLPTLIISTDTGTPHPYAVKQLESLISSNANACIKNVDIEALYQSGFLAFPITNQDDIPLEKQSLRIAQRTVRVLAATITETFKTLSRLPESNNCIPQDITQCFKTLLKHKDNHLPEPSA